MADRKNKNKAFIMAGTRFMSIIAISLTLFTLGVVGLLQLSKMSIFKNFEERIEYRIYLPENNSDSDNLMLVNKIKSKKYVMSAIILTPDSMAKIVSDKIGDNPMDVLGYNPFNPMVCINLKQGYIDSLSIIEKDLKTIMPDVELDYQEDQLSSMKKGLGNISHILEAIIILQLIVTFVQISNTTKLLIHSKRMQIRTLSLVGATKYFISKPIVLRSVSDGIIGAIISILILSLLIYGINELWTINLYDVISIKYVLCLYVVLVLISTIISLISSLYTSNKYVRMDGGKINLI